MNKSTKGVDMSATDADDLEVFLTTGTRAMVSDALAVCKGQVDPHAWAYALLALSAERAAAEAKDRMGDEAFEELRRVVHTHVVMLRSATRQAREARGEGAMLIASALASRLHP